MLRNLHVVATAVETMDDIELQFAVSKEDCIIKKIVWNEWMARAEIERAGSRWQVCVTKVVDFGSPHYIVSVPDARYSFEGTSVKGVAYNMHEKMNVAKIDAETIQMACVKMKSFMDSYEQRQNEDVWTNLSNAGHHLEKSFELIVEANKDGQMDFTTHSSESDRFVHIQGLVSRIDKIMFPKKG